METIKIFIFCSLLFYVKCHDVENCKYVTIPVCGDQPVSNTLVPDGEHFGARGPPGHPGKSGPMGNDGLKGQNGERGLIGEKGDSIEDLKLENLVNRKVEEIKVKFLKTSGADFCKETEIAGIYLVHGEEFVCDGNGWTIIQHRRDGSVNFDRTWTEFRNGFGSLDGEFWLGLRTVHKLLRNRDCQLKVELESFNREQAYAQYRSFIIDDEEKKFRLSISGYSGTAGDSMSFSDGMMFTTKDNDNDIHSTLNCAKKHGGWWLKNCFRASLNAPWARSSAKWTNIIWYSWKGHSEALDRTTMKILCS